MSPGKVARRETPPPAEKESAPLPTSNGNRIHRNPVPDSYAGRRLGTGSR
jgi:hypothetical protein